MDLPVLLVLYVAPTSKLYVRWAQGVSTNVTTDGAPPETTTIHFPDSTEKAENFEEALYVDLMNVRAFSGAQVPLPIPVAVEVHSSVGISESEIRARLRSTFELTKILSPSSPDPSAAALSISSDSITFELPTQISSAKLELEAISAVTVASDAAVLASLSLAAVGMSRDAVALAASVWATTSLSEAPQVVEALFAAYIAQGRAKEGLRILTPLLSSDDPSAANFADILLMPLVQLRNHDLDETDRATIESLLRQRAQSNSGTPEAGRMWYSVAQYNRRPGQWPEALKSMDQALQDDPAYGERAYYFKDRGGILYELGRYSESVDNYRTALTLGADTSVNFLLSDVLMLQGEYAQALEAAEQAIESAAPFGMQARLHMQALTTIRRVVGQDRQERLAISNEEFARRLDEGTDVKALLQETDALDLRMWSIVLDRAEDSGEALDALVVLCVVSTDLPLTWLMAIAVCIQAPSDVTELRTDLIDTALRFHGLDLLEGFDGESLGLDDEKSTQMKELIFERAGQPSPQFPNVVRIFEPGGSYAEVDLNSRS